MCILRDFIIGYGESSTEIIGNFVINKYTLSFHNADQTYRYDLQYVPYTASICAQEAYTAGSNTDLFTTSLYFTGSGASEDQAHILVGVDHDGTFVITEGSINPQSHTPLTPFKFTEWMCSNPTSDFYTQENCENTAKAMITDIINTTELVFAEYDIGFSITSLGYKNFFN